MGGAAGHASVAHAHDDGRLHDGHVGVVDAEYNRHAVGISDEGPRSVYARSHRVY